MNGKHINYSFLIGSLLCFVLMTAVSVSADGEDEVTIQIESVEEPLLIAEPLRGDEAVVDSEEPPIVSPDGESLIAPAPDEESLIAPAPEEETTDSVIAPAPGEADEDILDNQITGQEDAKSYSASTGQQETNLMNIGVLLIGGIAVLVGLGVVIVSYKRQ